MTIDKSLSAAVACGICLYVKDGRMLYDGPDNVPEDVLNALRQHKPELLDLLTTLEECPERSHFASIIEKARRGSLNLPAIAESAYETITDANTYVRWALGQVRAGTSHRMKVIVGLLRIAAAAERTELPEPCPLSNPSAPAAPSVSPFAC